MLTSVFISVLRAKKMQSFSLFPRIKYLYLQSEQCVSVSVERPATNNTRNFN